MNRYYGFDLGDAESAVARLEKDAPGAPEILTLREAKSFITAYALLKNGDLLIGESACYDPSAQTRRLRFKSRFLTDPQAAKDVKAFAGGVLGELYQSGELVKDGESCFYVGCPAGWNKSVREEYREIFEKLAYPPTKIISESRAALVSACQSRYLQVGYDILSKPVLVIDIGSSTTDFAFILGGREVELLTGGEVSLGGGIMDEILLEEALDASPDGARIRRIFEENEAWRSYCEFAARRLKERYFSDEEYWREHECLQTVSVRQSMLPARLQLRMDAATADLLVNKKVARLDGRSFREVFTAAVEDLKKNALEKTPELIFLTGGVSKLPAVRAWCRSLFPDSVVICGSEPEFSVASGLAYCGRIDEDLRAFKADVRRLVESDAVERITTGRIESLYRTVVDALVDPLLERVALPIVDRWRSGHIDTLQEIDSVMATEITAFLQTDEGRALLAKPVASWLKSVSYALEELTMPICVRHNVPFSALNLTSYLAVSDIDVTVESKDIFAVEEITWLIDAVVSILVALICGGSGVALISGGIAGILAGAVISLLVLLLGRKKMQEAMMGMKLPLPMRKMLPKSYLRSRLGRIAGEVKEKLYDKLEKEKSEEISERLGEDISRQIEECLVKMAEIVEIPLG